MDIIECLIKTGFTRHESILYLALCKEGELTGYEAAKISGIPRSNAYLALSGLVEKGGACRIESESVKYIAVPAKELVFNMRAQLNQVFDYIERNTPVRDLPKEPYITVEGKSHIINKMRYVIKEATERIYLSMSPTELECVRDEIVEACGRGLKIVVITSSGFSMDDVVLYRNEKQPGQIRLIADSAHVITGEIGDDNSSACLYSKNKNLIQLIKDSLTNEIKLIQLNMKDKG
ncbi:MAG: TrmB family transcriptional regulator [Clostridia bacterium]|nr:TrmB family transcriptional regulator [Clostridia bacterium]